MNRRVKLKLNRAKRAAKKYVFSTRYTVRNTCAVLLLGTVITGSIFAADKAGDAATAIKAARIERAAAKAEEAEKAAAAREQEEQEMNSVELEYDASSFITEKTVENIKSEIDDDSAVEMEANDTNDLTQSMYDMTGKFISATEGLNVRVATDTDAEVVATLGEGASGTVEGTDGDWTKIKSGDVEGFVKTEYILTDDAASEIAETSSVQIATIKDQQVNVRESASTDSDVIYIAVEGDKFVVNDENSGEEWTNVELADGTFAYVATDYVEVEEGFEEAVSQEDYNLVVDAKKQKEEEEARRQAEAAKAAQAASNNGQAASSGSSNSTADTSAETTSSGGGNAVEPVVTQEASVEASSSDLYLLAAIVYAESGGESYEGQLAVASVVMNRVRNGYWGSSISSVIYSPGQFAGAYTGAFSSALSTGGSSTSLQAAQDALNGANNVGGCMYFRPTWNIDTSSLGSYIQIGNHIFY